MIITKDNYYSSEADLSTMSVSQYKLFIQCEKEHLINLRKRIQDYILVKGKPKGN